MGLSSESKVKTARAIIDFRSKLWVCVGSAYQYMRALHADLHECVPAGLYLGPAYDEDSNSYEGLHFTCSHFMSLRWSEPQAYVVTGHEITIKISPPHEKNLYKALR